jgi:3'-phosphoadenosine 5'-phosphosulfate sulfotransferase (PAPS reductase)/FAD synthetase
LGTAIELKPSYWASVSGGKDSLFMLRLILAHPERYPLDGVVHFELEIDYPFIKDVIDYMETECRKHSVKFVRIRPRKSWYELYKKYWMPDKFKRWCNSEYKLDARRQLEQFMRQQGCYVVHYIGYCADEEKRYAHRGDKKKEVYPLVDFGVTEDRIWEWAKTQPIFNHYYQVNRRCGCMYCPCASRLQLTYLLTYYPDEYEKFMQMCRESEEALSKKLGKKHCIFQSNPKYDTDYVDRSVREKYLPKFRELERKVRT